MKNKINQKFIVFLWKKYTELKRKTNDLEESFKGRCGDHRPKMLKDNSENSKRENM